MRRRESCLLAAVVAAAVYLRDDDTVGLVEAVDVIKVEAACSTHSAQLSVALSAECTHWVSGTVWALGSYPCPSST